MKHSLAQNDRASFENAPSSTEGSGLQIGDSLAGGRYVITGQLGRGGMGTVYEARQVGIDRSVAVKILHREYSDNPDVVRRFQREALAVSRLTHPNSISIFDFGQSDGVLFMAMECLRGRTLKAEIAKHGYLPIERALRITVQILRSVSEAHRVGIVHRDLKPDNIFLTTVDGNDAFVKVLDFGVAKLWHADRDSTLTQAGNVFGTPKYMAPEQAREVAVDGRADVYSIGVLAYEMIVGRPPFVGDNPLSLLLAHAKEAPPRMMSVNPQPSVPRTVETLIFKALAKDRDHRFETTDRFADAIDEVLEALEAGVDLDAGDDFGRLEDALRFARSDSPDSVSISSEQPLRYRQRARLNPWPMFVVVALLVFLIWRLSPDAVEEPTAQPNQQITKTPKAETNLNPRKQPNTESRARPFQIESQPPNVEILDADTLEVLGKTPMKLIIASKRTLLLNAVGFEGQRIDVNPAEPARLFSVTLKPKQAKRPRVRRKSQRLKTTVQPDEKLEVPVIEKSIRIEPTRIKTPKKIGTPSSDSPIELD